VVHCSTSADLWRELQLRFSTQSLACVMDIKMQLHSLQKGHLSMQDYLDQKRSLADRLRLIGSLVSNDDLQLFILHGLNTEYDSLIVSLNSKPNAVPFNELAGLLLTHEQRLQKNVVLTAAIPSSVAIPPSLNPSSQMPQANIAIDHLSSAFNEPDLMSQFQVFLASKNGSWRNKSSFKGTSALADSSDRPICQLCAKKGHTADRCYKRFDATYKPPPPRFQHRVRSSSPQALLVQPGSVPPESWYLDSGASAHVSPDLNCFTSYSPYGGTDQLQISDGKGLPILHIGSTYLTTPSKPLVLSNMLHVPSISKPLLSISRLVTDNDIIVEFNASSCIVKDQVTSQVLLQGVLHNGLYLLTSSVSGPQAFTCAVASLQTWHYRLAHSSPSVLKHIVSSNHVSCNTTALDVCESCSKAKSHKQPFVSSNTISTKPLEIIHCDLWGPSPVVSHQGHKYYVLFTDHFSKFSWIYFCAQKSEVAAVFAKFKLLVENLFSISIKTLQLDGGTEFLPIINANPQIQIHISCPYTPQQNGVVERKHRQIVELSLASIFHAQIPLQYWSDIFESIAFVINRLPSASIAFQTPFELLFNQKPDYHFFRILGCKCFPYTRPYSLHKLSPRSRTCVFIGYSSVYKGYKCLDLDTNRVYISRHVVFDENSLPFKNLPSSSSTITSSIPISPLQLLSISNTAAISDSATVSNSVFVPSTPSPSFSSPALATGTLPLIPPITQVYSRRPHPLSHSGSFSQTPALSSHPIGNSCQNKTKLPPAQSITGYKFITIST
jgi:gag-polypeptide of LTR copia-type/GAG-pre-integrase domain